MFGQVNGHSCAITRDSALQIDIVDMDMTCFLWPIKSNADCWERNLRGIRRLTGGSRSLISENLHLSNWPSGIGNTITLVDASGEAYLGAIIREALLVSKNALNPL